MGGSLRRYVLGRTVGNREIKNEGDGRRWQEMAGVVGNIVKYLHSKVERLFDFLSISCESGGLIYCSQTGQPILC